MSNILAKLAVVIEGQTASFNKALDTSNNQLNKFAGNAANVGKTLVAGFGVIEIGKQIIQVTGEFQRFEAVLSNTLGSESKAQKALKQIQQFASETPFAVNELTGAFVKLANQGFTPSVGELKSLGDLASSTGKSFDQLAEAIIDAQTGEFERLKEFGIRAKKSGDQVTFTFKGIQTTVENTSDSIRGYILSLGDAEGVSGSMEKISATLEGRISNLGDSWDTLLLTIGNGTGILASTVGLLTNITTETNRLLKAIEGGKEGAISGLGKGLENLAKDIRTFGSVPFSVLGNLKELRKEVGEPIDSKSVDSLAQKFGLTKQQANELKRAIDEINKVISDDERILKQFNEFSTRNKYTDLTKAADDYIKKINELAFATRVEKGELSKINTDGAFDKEKERLQEKINTYEHIIDVVRRYKDELAKPVKEDPKSLAILPALEAQLKKLKDLQDSSFSEKNIRSYAEQIDVVRNKIKDLTTVFDAPELSTPLNFDIKFNLDSRNFLGIESTVEEHMKDVLDRIASNPNFDITLPAPEIPLDAFGNALIEMDKEVVEATDSMAKSFNKVKLEIGGLVSGAISSLAQSLGEAAAGTVDLGKALLQAIGKFAVQFGELLIASGVGTIALESGNPYAMIAGGAILVAAGAALSALSQQRESIGTGGGGIARSASSNSSNALNGSEREIKLSGEFRIQGPDLVYIINRQTQLNGRTLR
jgi:hypothetical protein